MAGRRRALIVTLGRGRGALAATRALTRAGWTVGVGTPDGGGMVGASNACAVRHRVPRPRGDGVAFVDGVTRAVHEQGYDVVFGGADDWMAALATYADQIPTRVAHPAAEVVHAALDKVGLVDRAHGVALSAPRTVGASPEELAVWTGAVVVKCRTHWTPGQTQQHRVEARIFPDAAAARPRVELLRAAGLEPVLQQPVAGTLGALVGVFHDGRLRGRVQQVAHRTWPTPAGVSARAHTVPVDERLATRAEALLAGLGWSGLVELQFLTGADGDPHLIDLNGRFYGSMALADAARPGLADAWGRMVLGDPVPPLADGRVGVRFAWTAGDLHRAGVEREGGLVRDVVGTLAWAATARSSVWDRRDVRPTLHLALSRLRSRRGGSETPPDLTDRRAVVPPVTGERRRDRDRVA